MTSNAQPLIGKLLGRLVTRPSDDQEAFKAILRQMRRYSGTSIIEAAMRILWSKHESRVDELQRAPWHVLLLVKWALKDLTCSLPAVPA